MVYRFKLKPEIVWAALVAASAIIAQTIGSTDPSKITDPRTWLVALLVALVRGVAGAIIPEPNSAPKPIGSSVVP